MSMSTASARRKKRDATGDSRRRYGHSATPAPTKDDLPPRGGTSNTMLWHRSLIGLFGPRWGPVRLWCLRVHNEGLERMLYIPVSEGPKFVRHLVKDNRLSRRDLTVTT